MEINITDIEDAITYRRKDLLNEIFSNAEQAINDDDKVLLQRQLVNAAPIYYRTWATIPQLEDYKQRVFDAYEQLEKHRQELFGRLGEFYPDGL